MTEPAQSLAALASAHDSGELSRDEYWRVMQERHQQLAEYASLLGRGQVRSIQLEATGLTVTFADGLRMAWHPHDTRSVPSVAVNHGHYEPEERVALASLAASAEVILDIGANAGFMALSMAQAARSRSAKIHAFEPVPSTYAELVRNVELNGLGRRIQPHAFALGENAGSVTFFVPAFHGSVAASQQPLFQGENREVNVEMRTLDAFVAEEKLERVDLIKCDVEGAELFALRGGLDSLQRFRPVLMLEMLRKWARAFNYHPNDILELLKLLGYRCYSLGAGELCEHPLIDDATLATNFFLFDPTRHAPAMQALKQALYGAQRVPSAAPVVSQGSSVALAHAVRRDVLKMVHHAKASHVGSCLSAADALAVLYAQVLRVDPQKPDWPERDRFILSKGHAAAALYAVLAGRGFFPKEWLERYCDDGSPLAGHVIHHGVPGVEVSTGSLGHGLSLGAGMALAARASGREYRSFVLMSDGECDEGSVWEAALFAGHQRLGRLCAIVDSNGWQGFGSVAEVLELGPFADKWAAFGWQVAEVDGHDHAALARVLSAETTPDARPTVVLARTLKGKGVGFMEDRFEWHYRSPNAEQLAQALEELERNAP